MQYNIKALKDRRQQLRNDATVQERILWQALKGKQMEGIKFRRQFGIGNYILDFYCPKAKLCIELDGDVHNDIISSNHDMQRNKYLNANGIYVVRIENKLIFESFDEISNIIKNTTTKLIKGELHIATRIVTEYNDFEYVYEDN